MNRRALDQTLLSEDKKMCRFFQFERRIPQIYFALID
jgi:hypothetical protein